jgi:hypothetical protein
MTPTSMNMVNQGCFAMASFSSAAPMKESRTASVRAV